MNCLPTQNWPLPVVENSEDKNDIQCLKSRIPNPTNGLPTIRKLDDHHESNDSMGPPAALPMSHFCSLPGAADREVEFLENPTMLSRRIFQRDFSSALARLREAPEEANMWVTTVQKRSGPHGLRRHSWPLKTKRCVDHQWERTPGDDENYGELPPEHTMSKAESIHERLKQKHLDILQRLEHETTRVKEKLFRMETLVVQDQSFDSSVSLPHSSRSRNSEASMGSLQHLERKVRELVKDNEQLERDMEDLVAQLKEMQKQLDGIQNPEQTPEVTKNGSDNDFDEDEVDLKDVSLAYDDSGLSFDDASHEVIEISSTDESTGKEETSWKKRVSNLELQLQEADFTNEQETDEIILPLAEAKPTNRSCHHHSIPSHLEESNKHSSHDIKSAPVTPLVHLRSRIPSKAGSPLRHKPEPHHTATLAMVSPNRFLANPTNAVSGRVSLDTSPILPTKTLDSRPRSKSVDTSPIMPTKSLDPEDIPTSYHLPKHQQNGIIYCLPPFMSTQTPSEAYEANGGSVGSHSPNGTHVSGNRGEEPQRRRRRKSSGGEDPGLMYRKARARSRSPSSSATGPECSQRRGRKKTAAGEDPSTVFWRAHGHTRSATSQTIDSLDAIYDKAILARTRSPSPETDEELVLILERASFGRVDYGKEKDHSASQNSSKRKDIDARLNTTQLQMQTASNSTLTTKEQNWPSGNPVADSSNFEHSVMAAEKALGNRVTPPIMDALARGGNGDDVDTVTSAEENDSIDTTQDRGFEDDFEDIGSTENSTYSDMSMTLSALFKPGKTTEQEMNSKNNGKIMKKDTFSQSREKSVQSVSTSENRRPSDRSIEKEESISKNAMAWETDDLEQLYRQALSTVEESSPLLATAHPMPSKTGVAAFETIISDTEETYAIEIPTTVVDALMEATISTTDDMPFMSIVRSLHDDSTIRKAEGLAGEPIAADLISAIRSSSLPVGLSMESLVPSDGTFNRAKSGKRRNSENSVHLAADLSGSLFMNSQVDLNTVSNERAFDSQNESLIREEINGESTLDAMKKRDPESNDDLSSTIKRTKKDDINFQLFQGAGKGTLSDSLAFSNHSTNSWGVLSLSKAAPFTREKKRVRMRHRKGAKGAMFKGAQKRKEQTADHFMNSLADFRRPSDDLTNLYHQARRALEKDTCTPEIQDNQLQSEVPGSTKEGIEIQSIGVKFPPMHGSGTDHEEQSPSDTKRKIAQKSAEMNEESKSIVSSHTSFELDAIITEAQEDYGMDLPPDLIEALKMAPVATFVYDRQASGFSALSESGSDLALFEENAEETNCALRNDCSENSSGMLKGLSQAQQAQPESSSFADFANLAGKDCFESPKMDRSGDLQKAASTDKSLASLFRHKGSVRFSEVLGLEVAPEIAAALYRATLKPSEMPQTQHSAISALTGFSADSTNTFETSTSFGDCNFDAHDKDRLQDSEVEKKNSAKKTLALPLQTPSLPQDAPTASSQLSHCHSENKNFGVILMKELRRSYKKKIPLELSYVLSRRKALSDSMNTDDDMKIILEGCDEMSGKRLPADLVLALREASVSVRSSSATLKSIRSKMMRHCGSANSLRSRSSGMPSIQEGSTLSASFSDHTRAEVIEVDPAPSSFGLYSTPTEIAAEEKSNQGVSTLYASQIADGGSRNAAKRSARKDSSDLPPEEPPRRSHSMSFHSQQSAPEKSDHSLRVESLLNPVSTSNKNTTNVVSSSTSLTLSGLCQLSPGINGELTASTATMLISNAGGQPQKSRNWIPPPSTHDLGISPASNQKELKSFQPPSLMLDWSMNIADEQGSVSSVASSTSTKVTRNNSETGGGEISVASTLPSRTLPIGVDPTPPLEGVETDDLSAIFKEAAIRYCS